MNIDARSFAAQSQGLLAQFGQAVGDYMGTSMNPDLIVPTLQRGNASPAAPAVG